MTNIYHAAIPDDWERARLDGEYRVSTRGVGLEEQGFIHWSYEHQVADVANRFYRDVDELVLLRIDPTRLDRNVIDEAPADGGDELFPHVYGPIPVGAVVSVTVWRRGGDGRYSLR